MAKTQTRRSVSINRDLYEALHALSEKTGRSMSQITEAGLRIEIAKAISPRLAQEFETMLRAHDTIQAGKRQRGEASS